VTRPPKGAVTGWTGKRGALIPPFGIWWAQIGGLKPIQAIQDFRPDGAFFRALGAYSRAFPSSWWTACPLVMRAMEGESPGRNGK